MNGNLFKVRLAIIGIFLAASQIHALSEERPGGSCPTNYTAMGAVCLNEATGDVVNQNAASYSPPQCRFGYELIQQVCVNLSSGDVELPSSGDR